MTRSQYSISKAATTCLTSCFLIVALCLCLLPYERLKDKDFFTEVRGKTGKTVISRNISRYSVWLFPGRAGLRCCFPAVGQANHLHITQVSAGLTVDLCVFWGVLWSICQQKSQVWRHGPELSKICHWFPLPCHHQSYLIPLCRSPYSPPLLEMETQTCCVKIPLDRPKGGRFAHI